MWTKSFILVSEMYNFQTLLSEMDWILKSWKNQLRFIFLSPCALSLKLSGLLQPYELVAVTYISLGLTCQQISGDCVDGLLFASQHSSRYWLGCDKGFSMSGKSQMRKSRIFKKNLKISVFNS